MKFSNRANRLLLAAALVLIAPACTLITPPPDSREEKPVGRTLEQAVAMLHKVQRVAELDGNLGVSHGRIRYRPGHPEDPFPANWSRYAWSNTLIAYPKRLFSTLDENTAARVYNLVYPDRQAAGTLVVFEGTDGRILGWAYNRDLATPEALRQVLLDSR